MRVPLAPSRLYRRRTVLPVVPPIVSPKWAGLHWTRESWPADADIYLGLDYFDLDDRLWHPIVGFKPSPGDVFDIDPVTKLRTILRTEDFIRSAHRIHTNVHGPWFRLDRPIPSLMRAIIDTTVPIRTALSVDWD